MNRIRLLSPAWFLLAALALTGPAAHAATTLKYLAFGDSITKGTCDTGNCPSTPNVCPNATGFAGYPGRLALFGFNPACTVVFPATAAACPTSCCVTNAGVASEVTGSMVTRIQTVPGTYDVLLFMGGTNDVFKFISNPTIQFNIEQIDTRAKNRDMDPMLASIIHYRWDVAGPYWEAVENLQGRVSSVAAARNRYFADPWTVLCPGEPTQSSFCYTRNYYVPGGPDPIGHPNGCGYDLMEDEFLATIQSAPAPGVPPTTGPSGDITDSTPTLSWTKASNATWHQVQVDSGGTWNDFFQVADSACSGGDNSCAVTTPALSAGSHDWRVRGRNPRDYGNWSSPRAFELFTAPPPVPTPSAPTGDFNAPNPPTSFVWSDEGGPVNGAVSYDLKIDRDLVEVFNGSVAASCGAGNCSVAPPIPITAGDYTWQVLSENPAGQSAFSSALAFRYIEAAPDTPQQIYPLGDETFDTTPPFRWNEAGGATEYKIEVRNAALATVFDSGFVAAGTVCGSACELESGVVLAPEAHTWRVTGKNTVGEGVPSAWADFTVLDCAGFPDLNLPTQTVGGTATEKACSTITAADGGNTYTVQGPAGDVVFHAGDLIVIDNGFEVETDATFTAITDAQ